MRVMTRIPGLKRLFENLKIKPPNQFKAVCYAAPMRGVSLRRGEVVG